MMKLRGVIMEKEFKELQEYIELIASTARLLDYEITSTHTTTIISKTKKIKLTLFKHNNSTITLITNRNKIETDWTHQTHYHKIDYLKLILQSL